MSRPVSRRSLVQAGAAMLGAVSVPVATATVASALPAPASPEAALAALIDQHSTATAEWNVLGEQWDEVHDRWRSERPPMPQALIARHAEGLGAFPSRGLLPNGRMGLIYGDVEVEQIRAGTLKPKWIGSTEPCPRAMARRAEVLAAYDVWHAECDAVSERVGLPDAEAKASVAAAVVESVEMAILAHRPSTMAGFVIKARWVAAQNSADDWAEQIVRDLCAIGETG